MAVISVRVGSELERKIRKLIELEKSDKSSAVRRALERGVEEELKKVALELYMSRKVSLAKAAEIAEVSVREMMEYLKERGVPLNLTVEELRRDFEEAMK
ncbi:Uncharacterized protein family {UPF0175} [Geoglobus ahangari]|uniref:Uncharacterized protein family (UPF0175) n=1 Tax=Geoglobus ahangari TaxID=113653 RepID=A0A0F7DBJ7_9EURY|nr:UPF0175 family protein [Geoglobus ahangari]AKG91211.1 Uncharacterized protein family {UPF0175} [Geoglobus ahangari]